MIENSEHGAIPFLKSLYRNCSQGSINLRFLPSGKNLFLSLSEIDSIPEILDANQRENVHFGVATRKDGDGTKQGIIEIPSLWIDLDFGPSEGDGNNKLLKVFFEFPLEPTFIIQSGGA